VVTDRKIYKLKFSRINMTRNDKKFRRTVNESLGILAIIGGTLALLSISSKDVDPENPKGREICYLSKEAANLPVTKADVDCYRVVIGEDYSKGLIAPKRVKPFQDYCVEDMPREEDGTCDYLPPRE